MDEYNNNNNKNPSPVQHQDALNEVDEGGCLEQQRLHQPHHDPCFVIGDVHLDVSELAVQLCPRGGHEGGGGGRSLFLCVRTPDFVVMFREGKRGRQKTRRMRRRRRRKRTMMEKKKEDD